MHTRFLMDIKAACYVFKQKVYNSIASNLLRVLLATAAELTGRQSFRLLLSVPCENTIFTLNCGNALPAMVHEIMLI